MSRIPPRRRPLGSARYLRPPGPRASRSVALLVAILLASCGDSAQESVSLRPPRVAPVEFLTPSAVIRHDQGAFTQGLLYHEGYLYESTGGRGSSSLRRIDPRNGEVVQRVDIAAPYFAEGIAMHGDRIYQLTWQEQTGFVYDAASLEQVATFRYAGEGWGLTSDGVSLIRSDGSNTLIFFDPVTFETERTLAVRDSVYPVHYLNELEWVDGEIWANVWNEDEIARIDPATGLVVGWLDLTPLVPPVRRVDPEAVANGIAIDEASGTLYITGKLWPEILAVPWVAMTAAGADAGM